MYKLTVMEESPPIYDSLNNPLPNGEVYVHTHQYLWKDDVKIGRVAIDKTSVKLILENNKPITISREKFQELFMKDAQIIELIFAAKEVQSARLIFDRKNYISTSAKVRYSRLYKLTGNKFTFYADIFVRLK